MAEPERRNENAPRTHVDDIGDGKIVEQSSRAGWRWWWIWPVVALILALWAGLRIGGRSWEHDALHAHSANATGPSVHVTGPGVSVLNAENKRSFIGKQFAAKDVPVQEKVNNRAIWIGSSNETPILAVVNAGSVGSNQQIDLGKVVNATGTVKKAPDALQAKREWSLPDKDAMQLEQEGAYIQLSQLTVPPQPR